MWTPTEARCRDCGHVYRIDGDIPVLLVDDAAAEHDELEHLVPSRRTRQMNFYDRKVASEFEISRPHRTPALYAWLYEEKFRRSIIGIEGILPGATALTTCAGSGMDAEFLARRGAHVFASDLSLGAAQRARERARRYGLDIIPLVADVERLPFADRSIEISYVHDGLHHLEDPFRGLAEMARVASKAVSLTEPSQAAATALAIRAGIAQEEEEAGNRVARLRARDLSVFLDSHGFRTVHIDRYAMYYHHEPGPLIAWLSRPGILELATSSWRVADALIGRFGNRLSVVTVRETGQ